MVNHETAPRILSHNSARGFAEALGTIQAFLGASLFRIGAIFTWCGIRLIAAILPRKLWYPALWSISRFQTFLVSPFIRLTSYRNDRRRAVLTACVLNHWLARFISLRPDCPIPIRATGGEFILEAYKNPTGVLMCSAHLPLFAACIRALCDQDCTPDAVVAAREMLLDKNSLSIWGREFPALTNDRSALVRIRTLLRQGKAVAILVDVNMRPNLFRLAQAVGAKVVFGFPELQPDGRILVDFCVAPESFRKGEESILSNQLWLKAKVNRILRVCPPDAEVRNTAMKGLTPRTSMEAVPEEFKSASS